jgi:aspartyl/asparaginyl beta-hydroxylase (cupin superfamily)
MDINVRKSSIRASYTAFMIEIYHIFRKSEKKKLAKIQVACILGTWTLNHCEEIALFLLFFSVQECCWHRRDCQKI